ncbi:MAG: hypothetical protein H0W95_07530 [Nocardioidaceae bacterium]|nr:hypothetical protein [Nocardioidaceae bacterium]
MSSSTLRLEFDPAGDVLEASRDCEADIFLQWYGNTRQQLAEEYGPYEQDSVFVSLVDAANDVLACVRFLTGSSVGLKTIDDVRQPPWSVDAPRSARVAGVDLGRTWDVATMGVRPGERAGRAQLAMALYHGLVASVVANEVSAVVAILDERVRRLLASVGLDMRSLPGTRPAHYLGSPSSAPVYARTASTLDRQRRDFPDAYRLVTLGVGLDGVTIPDRGHFRLLRVPVEPMPEPVSAGVSSLR